jgi:mRNA interferase RelE/StbE
MKTVAWTIAARRAFRRLPPQVQKSIAAKIVPYAETGTGDVKALVGRSGARLRVGDYRVIFVETTELIEVRSVGNRRDIYI